MKQASFFLSLILIFTFAIFNEASAYIETTRNGALLAKVSPERPSPGQEVSVSLSGYGYNLNRSEINWVVNNSDLPAAKNKTQHTISMGPAGTITKIEIQVKPDSGGTIIKTLTFYPAEINIVWEANSYTPPFYEGNSLLSADSELTLMALPEFINQNNQLISNNNIEYTWFKNGQKLNSKSGVGQNTLTLDVDRFSNNIDISVSAQTVDSTYEAEKSISIPVFQPQVVVYKVDPLSGPNFNREVKDNVLLTGDQLVLQAEPYFFATQKLTNNNLEFLWNINGKTIKNTGVNSKVLALQKPDDTSGEAKISVLIKNTLNRYEQVKKDLTVEFSRSFVDF